MKSLMNRFGKRQKRDSRRAPQARLALESLENRTMMAVAVAGAEAMADAVDDATQRGCASVCVGQQATVGRIGVDPEPLSGPRPDYAMGMSSSAHEADDGVSRAQSPAPQPRPEATMGRIGVVPGPLSGPRPDYAMGMSSSAFEVRPQPEGATERVGIAPLPFPYPVPNDAISDALAAARTQRHAGSANDYVMGMGWSAHECPWGPT